jgi:hypothetical protein
VLLIHGGHFVLWCIKSCRPVAAGWMWLCQHQGPAGGSLGVRRRRPPGPGVVTTAAAWISNKLPLDQ